MGRGIEMEGEEQILLNSGQAVSGWGGGEGGSWLVFPPLEPRVDLCSGIPPSHISQPVVVVTNLVHMSLDTDGCCSLRGNEKRTRASFTV